MLKATTRHPYRPPHLHFLIAAEGYETLITHLFVAGDQYLDSATRFLASNDRSFALTREKQPARRRMGGR